MPAIELRDRAERSPTCCFLCGRSTGPMFEVDVILPEVRTATGIVRAEGNVYICRGSEDTCHWQMSRKEKWITNEERDSLIDRCHAAENRIIELERDLEKASNPLNVVAVDEVVTRLEDRLGATA